MASPPTTPLTGPTENEAGPVGLDLARLVPNPLHGAPPSKLALGDDGADSEDEYAACEDDGVPPPEGERESSEMRRRPGFYWSRRWLLSTKSCPQLKRRRMTKRRRCIARSTPSSPKWYASQ
jgi:hypothetical protein